MLKLILKYLFLFCVLFVGFIQLNANTIQEDIIYSALNLEHKGLTNFQLPETEIKQALPISERNLTINIGDRKIEEINWNFSKKYSACNNQFIILFKNYFNSRDSDEEVVDILYFSKQNHYNKPLFVVFQVIKV